jgi:hypothetical protein
MSAPAANYWLDDDCARAFWDQHHAVPYQELVRDTSHLLDPNRVSDGSIWAAAAGS